MSVVIPCENIKTVIDYENWKKFYDVIKNVKFKLLITLYLFIYQ